MRGGSPRGRRRIAGLMLVIVAALGLGVFAASAPAGGLTEIITATDNQFGGTNFVGSEGAVSLFQNQGSSTHNVTADRTGPDGKPLFRTGNVSGGSQAGVDGTQFLEGGDYSFKCTIHPSTMTAELNVVDDASGPDPRPQVSVKIKSKKLERVVDSGKLKVRVAASEPTDADGVTLSAKKGAKGITKKAKLNVDAGDSKTAKLKLKKKAAEKLADLEKAKVKVTGEVDFGSPDKASKKLK